MASLFYALDAEDEIDALWETDENSAALIEELLCQLEERPELLNELCRENRHVTRDPSFEVKRFRYMWNQGYTIYALKIWPGQGRAIDYRVLYAHHPQRNEYHILTVMQREIDYDSDKELINRLIIACEEIGIPRHR